MVKRRKKTPAERAYSKQVKRIKQFISRAEKRGYQFSADVLPQRPKLVTQASVRKLANLTPEKLYQKAVYGGLATEGEIVPAIDALKLERSLRARKALETRKYNLSHPTQQPTNTPGFVPPERADSKQFINRADVLPQRPNRVTKASVRKLAKLTPDVLYQKAVYGGLATEGELVPAQEPSNTPGFEPPPKKVMKDSGYMMYSNVFDEFISRISTPTPELTYYGSKRQAKNREASERGRVTLYNLTMREVDKVGKSELGWRLEKHSDEVQDLILVVLYGSDAAKIASATSRLASIITGGLTVPELMDLAYEEEANEDWELPE